MKITKRQLRRIITETLNEQPADSLYNQRRNVMKNYTVVDEKVSYPYGRNRGDERGYYKYVRNDDQPIPESDLAIFKAYEAKNAKDPWSALSGIYKHTVSGDGMTLNVTYYKHTSG